MPHQKKPAYLLHQATGQARVRVDGREIYLGKYGTPASKAMYEAIVGEWLAGRDPKRATLTVDELALEFLADASAYYRHPDKTPTGEARNLRDALRPVIRLHGSTLVRNFGPKKLKAVREQMIALGMCRTNINRQVHRIRRMFSWGVENELVPTEIYEALKAVAALREGRTEARESEPIQPVDDDAVAATLPYLTAVVQSMIRLQLLTGARPGEICLLRPCDVTMRTDGMWLYRPTRHKTSHHGKERTIFIGPEGQTVLRPFLERPPELFCFSPIESETQRSAVRRLNRKTPLQPSQANRRAKGRRLAERYHKDSYCRAVARACELAFGFSKELRKAPRLEKGPERDRLMGLAAEWRARNIWSPNQLRHTSATLIDAKFGLEATACVLGHGDVKTTRIYAKRNQEKAAEIMRQIG